MGVGRGFALAFLLLQGCGRIGYDVVVLADADAFDAGAPVSDAPAVDDAVQSFDQAVADRDSAPITTPDAPTTRDTQTPNPDGPPAVADAAADGAADAPAPTMDGAPGCPAVCNGGCASDTCHITDPTVAVVCPAGLACEITCALDRACDVNLDCGDATSCHIRCSGARSCAQELHCGAGPCDIDCLSDRTCGKVFCGANSSCDVLCGAFQSCGWTVYCGAGACNVTCPGDSSCFGGVDCQNACACEADCNAGGCYVGMWANKCPSAACTLPDGTCTSGGACDVCQ